MLGWQPLDLVVVNLYPFEETIQKPGVTFAEAIEQIDIGGVALIRAAAKNHQRVTLVCDPEDYDSVLKALKSGSLSLEERAKLAVKGFRLTSNYDKHITNYLSGLEMESINLYPQQELRYGENPHQAAAIYGYEADQGPLGGEILHGKALSYNNLLDLDAAWRAVVSYQKHSIVIVKHLSPCGIASAEHKSMHFRPPWPAIRFPRLAGLWQQPRNHGRNSRGNRQDVCGMRHRTWIW